MGKLQTGTINDTTYGTQAVRQRAPKNLVEFVQPTHFITISLVQGHGMWCGDGKKRVLSGNDIFYGDTHWRFIRALSKELTPRTAWKKHKPMLRSACAIEGGTVAERFHLHLIIAKPESVSEELFLAAIKGAAAGNPWIMNGEHGVDIRRVEDEQQALRSAFYSTKRGLDRVFLT